MIHHERFYFAHQRESRMVERLEKNWHSVLENIAYWRELLYSDYQRYKLNGNRLVL